jgi:serine protease Do
MSRLSIELSPEEHKKIKTLAAITGISIRDYVLARLLPPSSDEELALRELETLLDERIESAKAGGVSQRTVKDIFQEVYEDDPAYAAGIKPGDIILMVDDQAVDSPNQLSRLVAQVGPGEKAKINLLRDGKELIYHVPMAERPEKTNLASLPLQKNEVRLGLDVQVLTAALAEEFEIKEKAGVLVSKVERGGLAHSEGVQEGDFITEINRQPVRSVAQFSEALEQVKPGQTVLLRIIRKARAFFIVLKTQQ